MLYRKQGADEEALALLTHALELTRTLGTERDLPYVLGSLAQVQIQREEWIAASESLAEAETIALALKTRYPLVEINYLQAQVALAQGQLPAARTHVEIALELAYELESPEEEAIAQRVLGQILAADQQPALAFAAFEKSFVHLNDRDPYETACTQLTCGQTLIAYGEIEKGNVLLQEAQKTFEELGAQRELTQLVSLQYQVTTG